MLAELCAHVIHIELQHLCDLGQLRNTLASVSFETRKFPLLMPRFQAQRPTSLDHVKLGEFRPEYFACKLDPLATSPQASSDDAVHGDADYPLWSVVDEQQLLFLQHFKHERSVATPQTSLPLNEHGDPLQKR